MHMIMRIALPFVLCLFVQQAGAAFEAEEVTASPWLFRTWQTDEGLPDNSITGVAQAADGYLWVATLGGLLRFDGARFEEFSTTQFPKVPNRNVRSMYLDRHQQLWLALDRGAVVRVGAASARAFDAEDGLTGSRVTVMADDNAGGIWLVAANDICRIRAEKVERIGAAEELPTGPNPWVATDGRGELWIARGTQLGTIRNGRWQSILTLDSNPVRFMVASSGGLWLTTATRVFKFTEGKLQELARLPERVTVRTLLEDRSGALWIGTGESGLLRFKDDNLEPVAVSHPEITAMTEDREGNLWVGTAGGGLNLLRPRAVATISTRSGLPFESVRSVCQDAEGWMWAVLQNGSVARGRGSQWNALTRADGWPGGNATCVVPAHGGGVWVGTHVRGLRQWQAGKVKEWGQREGLPNQNVRSLLQATNGDLWIATESPNGLHVLRGGVFHALQIPPRVRSIRALAEGVGGTIWAGSSDGQILRVQGDTVVNETGAQAEDEDRALSVRCLLATSDGSLWIGYAGWGVGLWREGHYKRIGIAQGLHDDYISQMLDDGLGGMWLAGNRGLFQVRMQELREVMDNRSGHLRSIAYGRGEGLPSVQPVFENSPTTWRDSAGKLWFATRSGLVTVQPDRIHDNPLPPPVLLTEVRIDDRIVAVRDSKMPLRAPGQANLVDLGVPAATLKLPPGHTKLEFAFTALSFSSPENVHFRYWLRGFDKEWIEAGTQRTAKYPLLPAGPYEFQVTACNDAGVWNETGFRFPFEVEPFLSQTWWFRIGVVALFTSGIIGLVRYFSFRRLRFKLLRLEQEEALHRERARIARDMHDEVGTKLSRLSLLSEMASHQREMSESARSEAAEISETARDTIRSFEEIVWAVNPRNDSLPHLMNYLCRFAEDFFEGSPTQCVFDLPDEIPAIELPTDARHHVFLAAKEAMNNVFKHAGAKRVRVRLTVTRERFEIGIEDDGRGFVEGAIQSRPGKGNGLDNMRERMKSVGGELVLQSKPGAGTQVVLRIGIAPGKAG